MFDSDTSSLIASAPPLPGLDLAELPQKLTNAYASLVTARIRLRKLADGEALPNDIAEIISETSRVAFSQEAFVSVLENRENRSAAAFAAGAAHHVTLLADRLRSQEPRFSSLGIGGISPEVSATILFLIAESSADAAEMSKSIVVNASEQIEAALLIAIKHLANGRLQRIIEMPAAATRRNLDEDGVSKAVKVLYHMLLDGIRILAASILGSIDDVKIENSPSDAKEIFDQVRNLCVQPFEEFWPDAKDHPPFSVFPGPLHLASLLSAASKDLANSALTNTRPPSGIDGGQWLRMMQSIALRRPFLWRNHRQAIEAGYLEPGTSAAISFPTGAGKSTLSELKIATALLRGVKIVFLAPTLALVDQTARALRETFPDSNISRERLTETPFDSINDALPAISVMTPERCLTMLSFDQSAFASVGLLVFDECHLLHPRDMDRSRRAVDAMLCVLNFTALAPTADLLFLSAMMKNAEEMSTWLASLTGRICLPLTLTWKPTRQVRGCVVYGEDEIDGLKARLRDARTTLTNKNAPAWLQEELEINPFGFFCLHQTWQSNARKDYALLPLLDSSVTLSTGTSKANDWYLTPNGNKVAAAIAESTARQGLKTLVFTQTIPQANSTSNALSSILGQSDVELTDDEIRLYAGAVNEFGGPDHLYIGVDANDKLISSSACHHGLLLPSERHLHESLFKRRDGINVLVATSTLAQGMNLPSEVVLIGGDSRFDPDADKMKQLEAHELLNAAGRAGRAGDGSYGFVLVVPSKVMHFNNDTNSIHNHWSDLRAIFSQSDQCLSIDDPFTALLDEIHSKVEPISDAASYLLRRLPVGDSTGLNGPDAEARSLLNRSFAAFRARESGNLAWVNARIDATMIARKDDPDATTALTWQHRLAASAAVPIEVVNELGEKLSAPIARDLALSKWYDWMISWLTVRPHWIPLLIRRESLEGLLGKTYKDLSNDTDRGKYAASIIFPLLQHWMAGDTMANLERAFGTKEKNVRKCENAREFVLRTL